MTHDISVLKFSGSSFATPADYRAVAGYLHGRVRGGERLVVVVGGPEAVTTRIRAMALAVNPAASAAALNNLLPVATTTGAGLLRIALEAQYVAVRQLLAHTSGLSAEPPAGRPARLLGWDAGPVLTALNQAPVAVLAGGQAADLDRRPSWLGVNSSDLSAVAMAVALGLDRVEIHSGLDGVYTANPELVAGARLLARPRAADVLTLARRGAAVPHAGAIELADGHGVSILCRSNIGDFARGSVIAPDGEPVDAVVADLHSFVVEAGTAAAAQRIRGEFLETRVAAHLMRTPHGRHVVAVHDDGCTDVEAFVAARELPGRITGERLVTQLVRGRAVSHLVEDSRAARLLAAHLHRQLTAPTQLTAAA